MATPSPYRSLPAEQRIELLTAAMKAHKEYRAVFIQRLASIKGGYRPVTLQPWPADKLAREVVRRNAESVQDEFDMLHFLYVEHTPAIQSTFLDAAGVQHDNSRMPDDLEPPFADAEAVKRGADAVLAYHDEDGRRYLRTLAKYSREGWPGIEGIVETMSS